MSLKENTYKETLKNKKWVPIMNSLMMSHTIECQVHIHLNTGMDKDNVEKLVRTRIQKHKVNPTAVDDELDQNAFNPMNFIIE